MKKKFNKCLTQSESASNTAHWCNWVQYNFSISNFPNSIQPAAQSTIETADQKHSYKWPLTEQSSVLEMNYIKKFFWPFTFNNNFQFFIPQNAAEKDSWSNCIFKETCPKVLGVHFVLSTYLLSIYLFFERPATMMNSMHKANNLIQKFV